VSAERSKIVLSKQEADLQRKAYGPNVFPIFHTMEEKNCLYHFMPIAGLGNLMNVLKFLIILNDQETSEIILIYIAHDLLNGLNSIHKKRIVHLDLKPENLLTVNTGISYISDFGLSIQLDKTVGWNVPGESVGDENYFSKTRKKAKSKNTFFDGRKADYYAAGLTLLHFLQLKTDVHELSKKINNPEPQSIQWIVSCLLSCDTEDSTTPCPVDDLPATLLKSSCFLPLSRSEKIRTEIFSRLRAVLLKEDQK